jgi:glycerol-3-phosphate acyltransferase PlsX
MIWVSVDAHGGDYAPEEVVKGALQSLDEGSHALFLVGKKDLKKRLPLSERLRFIEANSVVEMDEKPSFVIREKMDSSMALSVSLVEEKKASACVSAGNTGAFMSFATLMLKRIKGVERPAIAVTIPGERGPVVMLDAGANSDCKPRYLKTFAILGKVYAKRVLRFDDVKIGLLNIGGEEGKGSSFTKEGYSLLKELPEFVGNVEGNDVLRNACNVVVTDGFTGNIFLKAVEGAVELIFSELKREFNSEFLSRLGALLLTPSFKKLKKKLDFEEYGGAQLLGVNGVVTISHGRSKARAIKNAILFAARSARENVVQKITESLCEKAN